MTTIWEDRMIVEMSLKDHFDKAMSISVEKLSFRLNKEKLVAQIQCCKPLI